MIAATKLKYERHGGVLKCEIVPSLCWLKEIEAPYRKSHITSLLPFDQRKQPARRGWDIYSFSEKGCVHGWIIFDHVKVERSKKGTHLKGSPMQSTEILGNDISYLIMRSCFQELESFPSWSKGCKWLVTARAAWQLLGVPMGLRIYAAARIIPCGR